MRYFLVFGFGIIAFFISACSPQPVRVEGTAMMPTLSDGDKVMMDKNIGGLKRGDIVKFLYPKDRTKSYIKRVIGLPGETVEIREGKVFVNGNLLDEPYLSESFNQAKPNFPPRKVPEYQYFVLGDNRDNSSDSRYWGTVDEELIKGKYYMTYSKANE
jgi:signal peptidase I